MVSQERIIVLGAGVIGLTTAVRLLEKGFRVEVIADRHQPGTTGNLAAGLWYPYKVGGRSVVDWALTSLRVYREMAENGDGGIRLVACTSYVPVDESRPFWADAEVDFQEISAEDKRAGSSSAAFRAVLPVAEPGVLLPWLESRIFEMGGFLHVLDAPLAHFSELSGAVVVNCTGLGARHLCRDESVVPIRGVVVRMAGTGIDESVTDETEPARPAYIIPNRHYAVLGGSADEDRWDVAVSDDEVREIVERCVELDPRVGDGMVIGGFAGLRPGRHEVRLDVETLAHDRRLIHNYGHGGSGFTLAWGCAQEVVDKVSALTG